MQIQYNITRIEEWCQSKDMPEGTLQLEYLLQATKLLQLKKVSQPVFKQHFHRFLTRELSLAPHHISLPPTTSRSSVMFAGCSARLRFRSS